jgi:hypothetical protein
LKIKNKLYIDFKDLDKINHDKVALNKNHFGFVCKKYDIEEYREITQYNDQSIEYFFYVLDVLNNKSIIIYKSNGSDMSWIALYSDFYRIHKIFKTIKKTLISIYNLT